MRLPWDEIKRRAVAFSRRWEKAHREKSDAQLFVAELLGIFGVDDPAKVGEREKPVKFPTGRSGWIDFFWKEHVAIEMKSKDKSLDDAYEQLKDYMDMVPDGDAPNLWMVCDFQTMRLWRRSTKKRKTHIEFKLNELYKHVNWFDEIAGYTVELVQKEQIAVNVKAAGKMAKLHGALKSAGYDGRELEVYLVRLLFCLFADDTEIFPNSIFHQYIKDSNSDGSNLHYRLQELFEALNLPEEKRAKKTMWSGEVAQFRYINGKLFEENLRLAGFDKKMRALLLECCEDFDWGRVSPAVFGSMFQGVMDEDEDDIRRKMGAHYTDEENILKVVNPLFMDELWNKFKRVKNNLRALDDFHHEIASMKFMDPACGCGNFLIVAYRELRALEMEIIKTKYAGKGSVLSIEPLLKVGIEQFYGIEILEFPCEVARVGMWLIDHQMNLRLIELGQYFMRLPLTKSATIIHGNAIQLDWDGIAPRREMSYVFGNPPFVGARMMSKPQKGDVLHVFGNDFKGACNLDYVAAWYKKASEYMLGASMKAAFVSTNSISQGEQAAILWKSLMEQGILINFGIPPFKWSNEAKGKAAVHCVIVGFSRRKTTPNINPYLVEAPNVFIEKRKKPLCDVPEMVFGSMANDGGNLIIEASEYKDFVKSEPLAKRHIRRFVGSEEFINGIPRYCLWLADISPSDLRKMPSVMQRVEKVRKLRMASKRESTRKLAENPALFGEIRQPNTGYVLIPRVSSERRNYIPIGFLPAEAIASDAAQIIPNATLYHFGVLTSSVHMAWMRAVCGRLEMRYRYSAGIVYNNFPWADAANDQRKAVASLAKAVLDARGLHPDSSLADLYDPLAMPPELRKAHKELDRAVMKLYGFRASTAETAVVAELMKRHKELIEGKSARRNSASA